ncbi:hypothetical protein EW146_g2842 [Bondarzewia mesenterica]|uniref:Protein byr4 n=1 Tax=Bondarzewia mesenterica TaxID=1095465 RepID=A0A4S4LZE7_9AGAM|nr:hypothetical protein EW146_g2842 [Bondarzewia mesenterica]
MTTIPAPTITLSQEEWPDADFDLPDGEPLHASDAESDKDDDEDWDVDMRLGKTGGARAHTAAAGTAARSESSVKGVSQMITIRPPLPSTGEDDEDDEEGFSTIKVTALPKPETDLSPSPTPIDDDFEDAFALPSDLTQLSLKPLGLHHQYSKNSLEWGEKDQTSSSQSSDAYSTFGFADASPSSSNSTSASLPETEEEEEEDDGDLEGLIIPSGLFDSGSGGRHLAKLLEKKKRAPFADEGIKIASNDPEDNFESGLVIDDDADFSPSRLLQKSLDKQPKPRSTSGARSNSMPARPLSVRPPSRVNADRGKSPINPPPSSVRQLQKIKVSPSPPPRAAPTRSQSYQALLSAPAPSSSSFYAAKSSSLRGQKSHTGLKPPTPPSTQRGLSRKASMGALMGSNQTQASGSGSISKVNTPSNASRYDAPTAASRAKSTHTSSTSRMHGLEQYNVPPTRPSTPNGNQAALRLTMPTSSSRLKVRPLISNVFPSSPSTLQSRPRSPMRPPSASSFRSRLAAGTGLSNSGPKVLRKPKRQRTYGDGTELDGFDDLPTDRDKESRFRVQPKGYGNRVPGAMYPSKGDENKDWGKGTLRKRALRDGSSSGSEVAKAATDSNTRTLKRIGRIEFPPKASSHDSASSRRKKVVVSPQNQTRRKPTLIRNLNVVGEMKWNPQTLRWEGNDQALRDFDTAMGTSTRPALITHLTGSSVGSPVGSFASGARRVGNMIFDPTRMCWISTLSPEEDEPDVFADLADDEEDGDCWEANGGTIRAGQQHDSSNIASGPSDTSRSAAASRPGQPSPTRSTRSRSHTRSPSESGSDRGSRASFVCDVDDSFLDKCSQAEERHRAEMMGWNSKQDDVFADTDRRYLFDIRALATGNY